VAKYMYKPVDLPLTFRDFFGPELNSLRHWLEVHV